MELTVGELLDYIERYNIPRESKVLIQRVEDKYFKSNTGWLDRIVKKDNEYSTNIMISVDASEELKDQYIIATQVPHYAIDTEIQDSDLNLYISAHY